MMFARIRSLFAALDRGELDLPELLEKLDQRADASSREPGPSRKQTHLGLAPVHMGEP